MSEVWQTRIKVLFFSGIFASIGNWIATIKSGSPVTPFEALPGLALMFVIICVGCLLQELVEKGGKFHLPTILYISAISILLSLPACPLSPFMVSSFGKIGLLPICTPILAYAGISIGKDLNDFAKQGVAIVVVALCTFAGTFLGSAIIAQIMLKLTHVI